MLSSVYAFGGIVAALYLVSYRKDAEKTGLSLRKGAESFRHMAIFLAAGLFFAFLIDAFVSEDIIIRLLGSQTGLYGIILAALIGFATPGPRYSVYPLAAVLAFGGAGVGPIMALVCADEMIRPEAIPLEIKILGKRFFAYRASLSLVLAICGGFAGVFAGRYVNLLTISRLPLSSSQWASYLQVFFLFAFGIGVASLISVWVTKEGVQKRVGAHTGLKGIFFACLAGIATPGPLPTIYPLIKVLKEKGISVENLVAYITGQTLMGPLRIPLELSLIGLPFLLFRAVLSVLLSVIAGLVSSIPGIEKALNR